MLDNDINRALSAAVKYPWFSGLNDTRQNVVVDMIFNLGPESFEKFHTLHSCLAAGDWDGAVASMQNSLWHKQVKSRAIGLENQMRSGNPTTQLPLDLAPQTMTLNEKKSTPGNLSS